MAFSAPTLICQKRELSTKSYLNKSKKDDYIPAIIYGKDQEPIPVMLAAKPTLKEFKTHGVHSIFNLNISGEPKKLISVVREYQNHPVTGKIIHIDFMTVSMTEKFTSSVPVHIIGEEAATKEGGIIQAGLTEIEVECLPQDLPDNITYDISDLKIGNNVTVGDITPPQGVTFLSDPDAVIVTILAPSRATTEDEASENEAAEAGEAVEAKNEE
ncbi:Ribosomal protein L25, long-form [Syntrophomonas zehnderi OL-4]|uniref:Large ribosomal subunit protein bL25 n=1 Tax=Syntrophomonas zehnderi OL-4 TaxID=690567 RepID=A0A0E4GEP9_9FIRM|nr:50S ribosomal protein L25 [Syntrophomonas zehnderi]CFX93571.1 Ribosomal protein L25, long-form [Syntrophomonas zehnderi OL-4]